jgi:hypothetical protein
MVIEPDASVVTCWFGLKFKVEIPIPLYIQLEGAALRPHSVQNTGEQTKIRGNAGSATSEWNVRTEPTEFNRADEAANCAERLSSRSSVKHLTIFVAHFASQLG